MEQPWRLMWWDLNDPKNRKRWDVLDQRREIHSMILFEFCKSSKEPYNLETPLGIKTKIEALKELDEDLKLASETCPENITFTLTPNELFSYDDVYQMDEGRIDNNYPFEYTSWVFEIYYKNQYRGHVFGWTEDNYPDFLSIMGIRSSLINRLAQKCTSDRRGIASKLIKMISKTTGKRIFINSPLDSMIPILKKLGFKEGKVGDFDNYMKQDDYWYDANWKP